MCLDRHCKMFCSFRCVKAIALNLLGIKNYPRPMYYEHKNIYRLPYILLGNYIFKPTRPHRT